MVLIFDKFCKPYHKAAAYAIEIKMGVILVNAKDTYWCERTTKQLPQVGWQQANVLKISYEKKLST